MKLPRRINLGWRGARVSTSRLRTQPTTPPHHPSPERAKGQTEPSPRNDKSPPTQNNTGSHPHPEKPSQQTLASKPPKPAIIQPTRGNTPQSTHTHNNRRTHATTPRENPCPHLRATANRHHLPAPADPQSPPPHEQATVEYSYPRKLTPQPANMLLEARRDVEIEPKLTPLTGKELNSRIANTTNEARLDIRAGGVWERGRQAFLDLRVFDPQRLPLS